MGETASQAPVEGHWQLGRPRGGGEARRIGCGSHLRHGGQDGDRQAAVVVSSRPNEECSDRLMKRYTQLYWLRYSRQNCGHNFNGHTFL
eukprot:13523071-Heterocapsa_arctica.AAC.1